MSKSDRLPVIIGKNLRKGLMVFRNDGGYSILICWLKKDFETGTKFELEDVDKIQTVIHFCDRESVEQTVKALNWILKNWKVKDGKEKEKSGEASEKEEETKGTGENRSDDD